MTDLDRVADILAAEEGFVPHAYQDHLGNWTIGHGILIDRQAGGGITEAESFTLLKNRVSRITRNLDIKIPWWRSQPADVMDALILMAYQMGVGGLLAFRETLAALEAGDRVQAAERALDSRWATQTPDRAKRVAAMIRGVEV